jgi:hypothetical protein
MNGWPRVIQNNKIAARDLMADSRSVRRFFKALDPEKSLAYKLYTRPLALYNEMGASCGHICDNSSQIKVQIQFMSRALL